MSDIEMAGGTAQPGADPGVRHVSPVAIPPAINHDLHGFCWCQPLVEHTLDGDLYIHRRTLDSLHIERPA